MRNCPKCGSRMNLSDSGRGRKPRYACCKKECDGVISLIPDVYTAELRKELGRLQRETTAAVERMRKSEERILAENERSLTGVVHIGKPLAELLAKRAVATPEQVPILRQMAKPKI